MSVFGKRVLGIGTQHTPLRLFGIAAMLQKLSHTLKLNPNSFTAIVILIVVEMIKARRVSK